MNILLLSTYDLEGGAARATYRLHQGLQQQGLSSQMLVQQQFSLDPQVISPSTRLAQGWAKARLSLDALPLKRYAQRQPTTFSPQWLPDRMAAQVRQLNPDLVNLHWINEGFVQIETLARLGKPIVWTLHDMWPLTGGCHYSGGCQKYQADFGQDSGHNSGRKFSQSACGACPQLGSSRERDLSRSIWRRKQTAWRSLNLTIVALCDWMADAARASALFRHARIERIPNGIDPALFRPIPAQIARQLLGLPADKRLILFGSLQATSDRRKGFHLLQPALQDLQQMEQMEQRTGEIEEIELVVFGAIRPDPAPDFGLKTHYLGSFQDDLTLTLIYSAVDLFVLPSTEENLANTILEAMACGTPCVAFQIGGMPDLIEHQQTGYLAKPNDVTDLAQGLRWVLEDEERRSFLADRSRRKVMQEFTLEIQARRYAQLFAELCSPNVTQGPARASPF